MAEATPQGETGTPADPKTDATPPVTPTVPKPEVKTEDAAVEQLKKELEQQRMRANQLENEKKSRDEAEAKAKADELEEQNKFKDLYEQEKTKREAIEAEREKVEQEAELKKVKDEALAEFSEDVKTLAEEIGITLTDTDEASVNAFKEKMYKVNRTVAVTGAVGPNNPGTPSAEPELSGDALKEALQNEDNFHDIVMKKYPGIAAMTSPKK